MPKVSVCIPVYGVEKYIERCARSLFEQTMTDGIEFIFVNDCTKDRSIEILERILAEYSGRQAQTKIIHHEINKGLVAARNTGLAHATGDYIIHCDSDDWVDLDFYEKLYKKAVETGADVVVAPYKREYEKESAAEEPLECDNIDEYIEKNSHCVYYLWLKLYKRQIALDKTLYCPEHIQVSEDILRNIQMLNLCHKISFVSGTYYHYCVNDISLTHDFKEKNFLNMKETCDILSQKYGDKYSSIYINIKKVIFVRSMRYLCKYPALEALFIKEWQNTPLKEKIKIISIEESLKAKAALFSALFSVRLTTSLLRHIMK